MPQVDSVLELTAHDQAPTSALAAPVRATISGLGVDPQRADQLATLVGELISEARSREPFSGSPEAIKVAIEVEGDVVAVTVTDFRLPVNANSTSHLQSRRLAAMGFTDHLHIASHGRDGNVAVCRIGLNEEKAANTDEIQQLDDTVEPALPSAAIHIRAMTVADVDSLIRCMFRCYGYSYPDDKLYQRKSLRKLLKSGQMISVIGTADDGEVVGHEAMTFASSVDRIPEAGRFVVDPRYRGHHLAERLADARAGLATERGIPGLWAECVTNHPASQLTEIHLGGHEVGLLIGGFTDDVEMAGLNVETRGRMTLMAMYTPIDKSRKVVSNVPEHLVPAFKRLTERLDLMRKFSTNVHAPTGSTKLTADINLGFGVAHLRIDRIGRDLVSRVASEIGTLIAFELGSTHLDISLADRHAPWAINALEQLGFCWASWIPNARDDGDVLRLQRIGEHSVDIAHIATARPEGREVADHVISEWERVRRHQPAKPER
ncbi:MAG: GNAT family N-acetyltransferase [Actinomycetes bacterium]